MRVRTASSRWRWLLAGGLLLCAGVSAAADWKRGIEHQRIADQGNGTFLNPVLAGDHPDPSVLKDGDDYYLTLSSFDAYPGLPIWHSRDLVNWQPLGHAITQNVGAIWAPDLIKYGKRYYIYFPARRGDQGERSNFVVWADDIAGPWSAPIDIGLGKYIDPGHAVGEDGKRYLFLSGGDYVQLSDDGLKVIGTPRHVYDGWKYPEIWDVEGYAQEGPKITRHNGWYYMTTAVGGTAGPPTGHMVITARARSIHGPWQNAPNNPITRTKSTDEPWWSRGHATLVEGTDKRWWMLYHGYEHGYWTLGRQALLDPIEWTPDGWFVAKGGDLGTPLKKPSGQALPHGLALSDDFRAATLGPQWAFFNPAADEAKRLQVGDGVLRLQGKGSAPRDASPLTVIATDPAYQFEVQMTVAPGGQGGALLFYSDKLYAGVGSNGENFVMHRYGEERPGMLAPSATGGTLWLRVTNNRHIVTIHSSTDGTTWTKYPVQMEVSGHHHNVAGKFLALKPALYAAGAGQVEFRNFRYRALD
ncbi:family 43 glycosylhydrolase [Xanthomonas prunicola]|uniref:Family 43 glycosylhydrolase n=1 Tax=Xanthomonas prunicola TaxID=2053930 RepID=A0A9Q9MTC6_9XANT|nr:family 43 glycosylhydrolase [Xanthomonas prunicola]USJ02306.1 family 43 glycosylhydrolase [Xanthomonas prunicola]UXA50817.1 family 43 glycosylhydrolase [Xanthomonas prunicola]UXA59124.1 family 43 glycosylhydrolase [Xanthomonas prunicola]UXA67333.1 family 43 glycosylhydrolase [Xanthomonas prunicola]